MYLCVSNSAIVQMYVQTLQALEPAFKALQP